MCTLLQCTVVRIIVDNSCVSINNGGKKLPEKIYFHQAISRSIKAHDIDVIFGLMGDANLFMINDFVANCGGVFVPVGFEGSAVLMAIGHSHVRSGVSVASVTHGPGLTNCVTALTEGVRARRPIVLFAGDTAIDNPQNLQNIDQREIVKATGAGFEQVRSPEKISEDVAAAFFRAKEEKRPVVLNMPADYMWREVNYSQIVHQTFSAPTTITSGQIFEQAIGLIASAKRPLILAGIGAVEARDELVKLAKRMDAVLTTTLKANGLFNNVNCNVGICGTLSTQVGYAAVNAADVIVSFGASLSNFTTDHGSLFKGKRVVQISDDPRDVNYHFRPDLALIADPTQTAQNIQYWLDEAEVEPSGFATEMKNQATETKRPKLATKNQNDHIDFTAALDQLEQLLPENRLLVTDGGRFMTEVWSRISVPHPKNFIHSANFAAIGQGLQQAIGAAIAKPDEFVCLFVGDGGFMLGAINEFNTAVRLNINLLVVVCNDSAYGAEYIQFKDRQMSPALSQFDWPSFAEIATSLGGTGFKITSNKDLDFAVKKLNDLTGPVLFELCLDPEEIPRMKL